MLIFRILETVIRLGVYKLHFNNSVQTMGMYYTLLAK